MQIKDEEQRKTTDGSRKIASLNGRALGHSLRLEFRLSWIAVASCAHRDTDGQMFHNTDV